MGRTNLHGDGGNLKRGTRPVKCKCPRCGLEYYRVIDYPEGKTARLYCKDCKHAILVDNYDYSDLPEGEHHVHAGSRFSGNGYGWQKENGQILTSSESMYEMSSVSD